MSSGVLTMTPWDRVAAEQPTTDPQPGGEVMNT